MDKEEFKKWLRSINKLSHSQHRKLQDTLRQMYSRRQVSLELETPMEFVTCPHCKGKRIVRWGKRTDMQRYKCKDCNRTFNCLTGTPLAYLHRKGHWLDYAQCVKEGCSVRKAAKKCGIHRNTAFRWRHRFLENTRTVKAQCLQGIVEVDELYLMKSEKGSKSLVKSPRKRGVKNRERISKAQQVCVFMSRDRNHNVFDSIFDRLSVGKLTQEFYEHMATDALFCSKKNEVYRDYVGSNNIRHGVLDFEKGEYVKKDIVHIRNIRDYQQRFRGWVLNHFRGVATKYLENYLSWFRGLEEFEGKITPLTILLRAKSGGVYKKLPNLVTQPYFSP